MTIKDASQNRDADLGLEPGLGSGDDSLDLEDAGESELCIGLRSGDRHVAAYERRQEGKTPCSSSSPSIPLNSNEP